MIMIAFFAIQLKREKRTAFVEWQSSAAAQLSSRPEQYHRFGKQQTWAKHRSRTPPWHRIRRMQRLSLHRSKLSLPILLRWNTAVSMRHRKSVQWKSMEYGRSVRWRETHRTGAVHRWTRSRSSRQSWRTLSAKGRHSAKRLCRESRAGWAPRERIAEKNTDVVWCVGGGNGERKCVSFFLSNLSESNQLYVTYNASTLYDAGYGLEIWWIIAYREIDIRLGLGHCTGGCCCLHGFIFLLWGFSVWL